MAAFQKSPLGTENNDVWNCHWWISIHRKWAEYCFFLLTLPWCIFNLLPQNESPFPYDSCSTHSHWHWVVLLLVSTSTIKPLLIFLGLGGVGRTGEGSRLSTGATEQLFAVIRGRTTAVLGMTDSCLSPSGLRGGRVGGRPGGHPAGSGRAAGFFGLHCGRAWMSGVDWLGGGAFSSVSPGVSLVWLCWLRQSGADSFCMLFSRAGLSDPGLSQLSVRRREPSCMRLVATTAFIAACLGNRSHCWCARADTKCKTGPVQATPCQAV